MNFDIVEQSLLDYVVELFQALHLDKASDLALTSCNEVISSGFDKTVHSAEGIKVSLHVCCMGLRANSGPPLRTTGHDIPSSGNCNLRRGICSWQALCFDDD